MAKAKKKIQKTLPHERVIRKIFVIRGQKVILDRDMAELYEVETKVFNQAVKRNLDRFPPDFMFQLTKKEFDNLRSQFVTSSWGGSRYLPYVFTEQGAGMLSSILNSKKAISMNIAIIRAFAEIRKVALHNKNIADKLKLLEDRIGEHDLQLGRIYDTIEDLLDKKIQEETWKNRKRIGFK